MAEITKHLGIAIADADAGRITKQQLLQIFQDAIDNGDILETENEFYVVANVIPLVDAGALDSSAHLAAFETRMNARAMDWLNARRGEQESG